MKHDQQLIVLAGLCVLLGTTGGAFVNAADQVTRISNGATLRGKFTTLSTNLIVLERSNGATEEFTPDDIQDLRFDREPAALQKVRTNIRIGAFGAALESLETIRADYSGGDRRVIAELEFLAAQCQAGLAQTNPGAAAAAITSLTAFRVAHRNNFRFVQANLLLAQLLVDEDPDQAVSLLKQVQQSGVTGFELQAGVILGNILLRNGNPQEALTAYDDVVKRSKENPDATSSYYEGQIGRAKCLRIQEEWDQAVVWLEQLIAEVPDEQQATLARAWNQVGDCERAAGNDKAALMAYLHVDVLYAAAPAEHAESLYWLADLWETAGHPERGADARLRLQTQYPNSKWVLQSGNE